MPRPSLPHISFSLTAVREFASTAAPFALLALALLVVAYLVLDPSPPRHVVLATGVDQGAYAEFGKRYAARLAQHHIRVELRATQGAAENLQLLREGKVDLAFVQGGADRDRGPDENPDANLRSLGSMFYEPVWLFYREESAQRLLKAQELRSLSQLPGWRVNIGAPGSGVPNLMQRLIEANRIEPATLTLQQQPQTPAVVDLLEGRIDALVFASAPESLMVQMLLQTPGIRLFDFAQAEAYARRFPFLTPVNLPRGVVDLAGDLPRQDVHLVAPTATLVARESLHPALVQLFVQAAQQVHGEAGWFQRKGDFPNARDNERALHREAERVYSHGEPLLQRYLPFWLANLIDRMWVVLLSIVGLLIPLSRVVPPLVEFRIRSRVFRWYGQLRAIEAEEGRTPAQELNERLDEIEARVAGITLPLSYADELYALKGHIQQVRRRLQPRPA
ncbi:TAXI family TRAP transporter solute-binding subunit [Ideonella sp. BN130291]|uniref:TAXI family TRAP transporter solute-binding subunit n=1 Tax=Ideonella sp. BN130291 TaxID=3112940 RepID=UPI002E264559|nr:TAXI family TRAP transporter solute-binding subunit [Ideonella sp. BN130291]